MGRQRKKNKHLPQGMQHKNGAYYFAKNNKWHPLGKDYSQALIKYADFVGSKPRTDTVAEMVSLYIESHVNKLKPATVEGYRYSAINLGSVFGHMGLNDLTPAHVYRYLIERGDVQANRDRALLSASYTHARRIGAFTGDDPTKGLQYRNKETPRARYVTDAEHETAIKASSPKLACIIQFLYLTGMRQGDGLRVKLTDITDDGIAYTAGKTGKKVIVEWSDELRAVVEDAKRLWRRFGREYLFESNPKGRHAKRGPGPYTPSGLRALWRVAREQAGLQDITLHDFRGKAGSDLDTDADAQKLLDHSDGKVTKRHYRRKASRVNPVR